MDMCVEHSGDRSVSRDSDISVGGNARASSLPLCHSSGPSRARLVSKGQHGYRHTRPILGLLRYIYIKIQSLTHTTILLGPKSFLCVLNVFFLYAEIVGTNQVH